MKELQHPLRAESRPAPGGLREPFFSASSSELHFSIHPTSRFLSPWSSETLYLIGIISPKYPTERSHFIFEFLQNQSCHRVPSQWLCTEQKGNLNNCPNVAQIFLPSFSSMYHSSYLGLKIGHQTYSVSLMEAAWGLCHESNWKTVQVHRTYLQVFLEYIQVH